jgi:two-component system sensor histidine kinase KdpD
MKRLAYAWAIAGVLVVTAVGLVLFDYVTLADVAMAYLSAIMLAALAGRGPSLLAATLSVAAFDFCFVPPRFTLAVSEFRYLLTFAVMFGAGIGVSELTIRLRRQAVEARDATLRARAEQQRSDLLSAVSHDLRTPLAVITGAATSLRDDAGAVSPELRAELLDTVVDEARRLERVLTNLLNLTRVESGVAPARDWVPADELVGGALARLDDQLGDLPVAVDLPADLLLSVDPILFEQVIINLVDNAIKHGRPPIEITGRRSNGVVTLEVADHGAGIPADAGTRLFDKFVRAPGSGSAGVGLGLAICRGIVEAHGGRIALEPSSGGGARVRLQLPTPPPPEVDA